MDTIAERLALLDNLVRWWKSKVEELAGADNRNAQRIARRVLRDFEKERKRLTGDRRMGA